MDYLNQITTKMHAAQLKIPLIRLKDSKRLDDEMPSVRCCKFLVKSQYKFHSYD